MSEQKIEIKVTYNKNAVNVRLENDENIDIMHMEQCSHINMDYGSVSVCLKHLIDHIIKEIKDFQGA